jgi:hypothetical protein
MLVLILTDSCSTYESIQIQVLKPAQVKITSDINKVLLINHSIYNKSSFTSKTYGNIKNENIDSARSDEFFNGLFYVLSNSPRFELVNINPIYIIKANYNESFKSLDWPTIQKLCNDSDADAAIVLENFKINYSPKIKLHYFEDQGYFKGTLEMINNSLWNIYLPSKNKLEDDYLQKDTLYWDGYGDNDAEVYNQLPEINEAILQSCYYAGIKYGERIAQTWEVKDRYLIYCNNKDFMQAFNLAKQDKWDEAIEIWKKFPYGKRKRLAAYASYNLAVANETLDQIDLALEWASKSLILNNNKLVEDYIDILEKRKSEKEKIENQFN